MKIIMHNDNKDPAGDIVVTESEDESTYPENTYGFDESYNHVRKTTHLMNLTLMNLKLMRNILLSETTNM